MPLYNMADGTPLFVRTIGQGQPVLVLSGLGMQSWQWLPYLLNHRKTHQFIIPDWRGFGGSSQCTIPNVDAIHSHCNDLEAIIQHFKIQSIPVIAYSMGATTAMHAIKYCQFNQHIERYLHIDQTPKIKVDTTWEFGLFGHQQPKFIQLLSAISQLLAKHQDIRHITQLDHITRKQLLAYWIDFIQLQSSNKLTPWLFKLSLNRPYLHPYVLPIQRLDYLAWYINTYLYHDEDYRNALSQLTCPTTFFTGEQSTLYPAIGQNIIAKNMPQAKQVLFHSSGHTPLITEPFKFGQEISKFLNA